jgi:hypothetical protein
MRWVRILPQTFAGAALLCAILACMSCDAGKDESAAAAVSEGTAVETNTPEIRVAATSGPSKIGMAAWSRSIAASGDLLHAVWRDSGALVYARSSDGGMQWGGLVLDQCDISKVPIEGPFPRVSATGQDVYVSWYCDAATTNPPLFLYQSHDQGRTWTKTILAQLTFTRTDCDCSYFNFNPAITAAGPDVHVAWTNEVFVPAAGRAWSKIFLRSSHDHGATWQPPVLVSSMGPFDSWVAAVATTANGTVHVAWVDKRAPSGNETEFYRRSFDQGATFTEPERQLTFVGPSWAPSLAASGNSVHRRERRFGHGRLLFSLGQLRCGVELVRTTKAGDRRWQEPKSDLGLVSGERQCACAVGRRS